MARDSNCYYSADGSFILVLGVVSIYSIFVLNLLFFIILIAPLERVFIPDIKIGYFNSVSQLLHFCCHFNSHRFPMVRKDFLFLVVVSLMMVFFRRKPTLRIYVICWLKVLGLSLCLFVSNGCFCIYNYSR